MEATTDKKVFIEDSQVPWQQVDKNIKRKIMGWDNNIMMVKVAFEKMRHIRRKQSQG